MSEDQSNPASERHSISSNHSELDDYWWKVLTLCEQSNPTHFGLEFPSRDFDKFEYLDSGTYSHVIKALDRGQRDMPVVFKIIKVMQRVTVTRLSELSFKGFELYGDVYQEMVIIKMLSNLHLTVCDHAGYEYQAHSYPKIYRVRVVHGDIPNYMLIRRYDESVAKVKPVERFEDTFGVPREHLVIVMKFGGDSLWDRMQARHPEALSPEQLLSALNQVVLALAVAELLYQFEHRDLHVCNILVKATKKKYTVFKLRSTEYRVKSYGIKACIIDATFSRMALAQQVYYTDLSNRLRTTAANTKPDGQEKVYQKMYQLVADRWENWFPETNIHWLKYCFEEILTSDAFANKATAAQKDTLKTMIENVTNFKMVSDFILSTLNGTGDQQREESHAVTRNQAASMSDFE